MPSTTIAPAPTALATAAERLVAEAHRQNGEYVRRVLRDEFYLTDYGGRGEEQEDPHHRRYQEWTIGHSELPASMRLLLRLILLHEDGAGTRPCTAGPGTLAREASLSEFQVRTLLRRATGRLPKHLRKQATLSARRAMPRLVTWGDGQLTVDRCYDGAAVAELRAMWASPRAEAAKKDGYLERARNPEAFCSEGRAAAISAALTADGCDGDGFVWDSVLRNEALRARFPWLKEFLPVPRFDWIRELLWEEYKHQPTSPVLHPTIKAVALAVDLLVDGKGRPFRWTTVAGIARLSGLRWLGSVRRALATLERAGWLRVSRPAGRGLLLRLCLPAGVAERMRYRELLRFGEEEPDEAEPTTPVVTPPVLPTSPLRFKQYARAKAPLVARPGHGLTAHPCGLRKSYGPDHRGSSLEHHEEGSRTRERADARSVGQQGNLPLPGQLT